MEYIVKVYEHMKQNTIKSYSKKRFLIIAELKIYKNNLFVLPHKHSKLQWTILLQNLLLYTQTAC